MGGQQKRVDKQDKPSQIRTKERTPPTTNIDLTMRERLVKIFVWGLQKREMDFRIGGGSEHWSCGRKILKILKDR